MVDKVPTPKSLDDENSVVRSLEQLADEVSVPKTNNPAQAGIEDMSKTQVMISPTYLQAEVTALAAEVKENSDKIDTVLAALRASNILEGV